MGPLNMASSSFVSLKRGFTSNSVVDPFLTELEEIEEGNDGD